MQGFLINRWNMSLTEEWERMKENRNKQKKIKNGQMMMKGIRIYYGDIIIIDLNSISPIF